MKDPYRVLEVDPDAGADVIAAAYRALAKRYHPDSSGADGAAMVAVNAAYEVLGEPASRTAYDRRRARAPRMPFGKYRDRRLDEIPTAYLSWLAGNIRASDVATAARQELRRRMAA